VRRTDKSRRHTDAIEEQDTLLLGRRVARALRSENERIGLDFSTGREAKVIIRRVTAIKQRAHAARRKAQQ
jgi:hypothetical protein